MRPSLLRGVLLCAAFVIARAGVAGPLDEPIKPLQGTPKLDPARVEIGRKLFHDPRLSANGKLACAGCHDLAKGGVDGRFRSVGFDGQTVGINTPTVLNSGLNFKQFWNGRAESLEAQIEAVVANPVEIGSKWEDVVTWIAKDKDYKDAFGKAYKDGVTKRNIVDAIATFERSLVTPSRFDRYLLGDQLAISGEEKAGYAKFKQYGCIACHQGQNIGGNMFQTFGVMGNYFQARGNPTDADLGRFSVTKRDGDQHVFKVPSLRNIALTAPYFHDGSAATLEDAVEVMFKYQLGRTAPAEDKGLIVKFLKTLTGEKGAW